MAGRAEMHLGDVVREGMRREEARQNEIRRRRREEAQRQDEVVDNLFQNLQMELRRIARQVYGGEHTDTELRDEYERIRARIANDMSRERITDSDLSGLLMHEAKRFFTGFLERADRAPNEHTGSGEFKSSYQIPRYPHPRYRSEISTQPVATEAGGDRDYEAEIEQAEIEEEKREEARVLADTRNRPLPAAPDGRPDDSGWDYDPWDAADVRDSVKESSMKDDL